MGYLNEKSEIPEDQNDLKKNVSFRSKRMGGESGWRHFGLRKSIDTGSLEFQRRLQQLGSMNRVHQRRINPHTFGLLLILWILLASFVTNRDHHQTDDSNNQVKDQPQGQIQVNPTKVQTDMCSELLPRNSNDIPPQDFAAGIKALQHLRRFMESFPSYPQSTICACRAIGAALVDSDTRVPHAWSAPSDNDKTLLAELALLERLIADQMAQHPDDPALQRWCSHALGSVAATADAPNHSNSERFRSIQLVEAAMARHPLDEGAQAEGCFALSSLARPSNGLGEGGQFELVKQALVAFPLQAHVQEQCVTTLGKAVGSKRLAPQLGELRVIAAAERAMERFGEREAVQVYGGALLAAQPWAMLSESLQRVDLREPLRLILRGLERHQGSEWVQRNGAYTLASLSQVEQALDAMAEAGEATMGHARRIMREHAADAEMQSNLLALWVNLANREDIRGMIDGAGTLPLVVRAMQQHGGNAWLQQLGLKALGNMALKKSLRHQIDWRAVMALAQETMGGFPGDLKIQAWGCRLMGVFAADPQIREGMGDWAQLDFIKGVMEAGSDDALVQEYMAYLVGQLAYHPTIRPRLNELGFKSLLHQAALNHEKDEKVQKWVHFALRKITSE